MRAVALRSFIGQSVRFSSHPCLTFPLTSSDLNCQFHHIPKHQSWTSGQTHFLNVLSCCSFVCAAEKSSLIENGRTSSTIHQPRSTYPLNAKENTAKSLASFSTPRMTDIFRNVYFSSKKTWGISRPKYDQKTVQLFGFQHKSESHRRGLDILRESFLNDIQRVVSPWKVFQTGRGIKRCHR